MSTPPAAAGGGSAPSQAPPAAATPAAPSFAVPPVMHTTPLEQCPSFLARVIAPQRSSSIFRVMNPELFVERTKKVSFSGWVVTGMVAFVVVTIGYTQWEYMHTSKRTEAEAVQRQLSEKEARKDIIRKRMDAEEGVVIPRHT